MHPLSGINGCFRIRIGLSNLLLRYQKKLLAVFGAVYIFIRFSYYGYARRIIDMLSGSELRK